MPFIIWGSRGVSSTIDQGRFFCPQCNAERNYELKDSRPYFTIFFIPIFPIGGSQRYVECEECRGTFLEGVLDMAPASEEDRFLGQLFNELNTGSSLEIVRSKLEAAGIKPDQAQRFLDEMTQGKVWTCDGCGDHYLNSVKQCLRCKA